MKTNNSKLVIFGAGRIGRSFLGQLFSNAGYEVVFIDIDLNLVNALNNTRSYDVIHRSDHDELIRVKNVRAIHTENIQQAEQEISTAGILALSVGIKGLRDSMGLLAKGLLMRYNTFGDLPIDIIIAENLRNADTFVKKNLVPLLPLEYPFDKLVGLVQTSIGKMVPIQSNNKDQGNPLYIIAEPYNSLIVDAEGFKNSIPTVQNLEPKTNINAWVDRKLFIHNMGHASTAYLGYYLNPETKYIHEVLSNRRNQQVIRSVMQQSADILLKKYPDVFNLNELTLHIDDLIARFQNKALGDTIYRVGCDLQRKLGPEDRFAGAISMALEYNCQYDKILQMLAYSIRFRAKDESGSLHPADNKILETLENGPSAVLSDICKFNVGTHQELFRKTLELYINI